MMKPSTVVKPTTWKGEAPRLRMHGCLVALPIDHQADQHDQEDDQQERRWGC